MDRFLTVKKRSIENPSESLPTNAKITKRDDNFRIVTMNSNSLANRISDKKNHADLKAFIECHLPDIVAIQEVRLPAKTTSSNPKKNDGSRRDRTKIDDRDSKASTDKHLLKNCEAFKDYQTYYSLSDWRYAGTAIALRKNSTEPLWTEYTFKAAEEKSIKHQELQMLSNQALSITPIASAAENAVLECTAASEEDENENENENENEKEKEKKEKGSNEDIKSRADSDYESSTIMDGHYADGRVICMGFPSFDLLATYSPNNGSSDTSFQRRRLWDKDTHLFVERSAKRGRPLVWVGDLNVAHTPADVTHPAFFSQQMRQPDSGNSGQAGYTPNERLRFNEALQAGNLVDTYRHFNPVPATSLAEDLQTHKFDEENQILNPLGPNYTWRGSAGTTVAEGGRYYGKGMRIDYALVSQSILPLVVSTVILGKGRDHEGFLGSDHCPVMLTLQHT